MTDYAPYAWQEPCLTAGIHSLDTYGVFANGSEMGTGKTLVTCFMAKRRGRRLVVVCPKSVVGEWEEWGRRIGVDVAATSYGKLRTGKTPHGRWQIAGKYFKWTVPADTDVVVDEAHECSGLISQQSELLCAAARQKLPVVLLSGTLTESPLKMKAIGYALGLHKLINFWDWAATKGVVKGFFGMEWPYKAAHKRAVGDRIMEGIREDLGKKFFRIRKAEVPGFPEKQVIPILLKTKPFNGGLFETGKFGYEARMAAELLKVPPLVERIRDTVNGQGHSVAVFVNYLETLNALREEFPDAALILGGQSLPQRAAEIERFQSNKAHVILVMTAAGGTGVSLHDLHGRPRTSFLFPGLSASKFLQAIDRIHRAGSVSHATVYVAYAASIPIEERARDNMEAKLSNLASLNDADLLGFPASNTNQNVIYDPTTPPTTPADESAGGLPENRGSDRPEGPGLPDQPPLGGGGQPQQPGPGWAGAHPLHDAGRTRAPGPHCNPGGPDAGAAGILCGGSEDRGGVRAIGPHCPNDPDDTGDCGACARDRIICPYRMPAHAPQARGGHPGPQGAVDQGPGTGSPNPLHSVGDGHGGAGQMVTPTRLAIGDPVTLPGSIEALVALAEVGQATAVIKPSPALEAAVGNHVVRTHAKSSPSKLKNQEICPSYESDNDGPVHPVTLRGTAMHEALETGNDEGLLAEKDNEELRLVTVCRQFQEDEAVPGEIVITEPHLKTHDRDVQGFADRVVLEPAYEQLLGTPDGGVMRHRKARIRDYKMGWNAVDAPDINPQAIAYTVAVFLEYPDVTEINFAFLIPRLDLILEHTFYRHELDALKLRISTIAERRRQLAGKEFNIVAENCLYCGRKATCTAMNAKVLPLARAYDDVVESKLPLPASFNPLMLTDPQQVAYGLNLANVMESWIEQMRKHATGFRRDNGIEIPGYDWIERSAPRVVSNPVGAFDIVTKEFGVTPEAFLSAAKISVTQLTEAVAAVAPKGEKAKAEENMTNRLMDSMCITRGMSFHVLQKQRKKAPKKTIDVTPAS